MAAGGPKINRHPQCAFERAGESAPSACGFVEGGAQASREFLGIVIGPEVKKENPRLLRQHVAVNRGHFDAVGAQSADHVGNFGADQGIVARDRRFAAAGRLEVDGGRATHDRCAYSHSLLGNRIAAGYVDCIDPSIVWPFGADDLVNLSSVEIDHRRLGGR